jgi:hypothetical protein
MTLAKIPHGRHEGLPYRSTDEGRATADGGHPSMPQVWAGTAGPSSACLEKPQSG